MPANNNHSRGAIPKKKRASSSKEVPQPAAESVHGKTQNWAMTSNINTVPPTQRQLNVLVDWAQLQDHHNHHQQQQQQQSGSSVHSKPRNNRGVEGTGFEIDNLSLQDHNNKFIPVRPIPRKNFANLDDQSTSNTAIVIPTTPNSSTLQQSSNSGPNTSSSSTLLNDNNFNTIHILTPITRMDNSANTASTNNPFRNTAPHHPLSRPNIEDKLNQIQEYIRITTSLIDSVQNENCNPEDYQNLVDNLTSLRDSERKLIALLPIAEEDMETAATNGDETPTTNRLNPMNGFKPINSNSLSDVSDAEVCSRER